MKQEVGAPLHKASPLRQSPAPTTRIRGAKTKQSPRAEAGHDIISVPKPRAKPVSPQASGRQGPRRSIFQSRVCPAEDLGSPSHREMEEKRLSGSAGGRGVEQYVRLRRKGGDTNCKGSQEDPEKKKARELEQRLEERESQVGELQGEVLVLKTKLEKLQSLNVELETQNKQLAEDLSAANSKISALERENKLASVAKEAQQPDQFKDIRKLISNKLENLRVQKDPAREMRTIKVPSLESDTGAKSVESETKSPTDEPPPPPLPWLPTIRHGPVARPSPSPPPPPPPPPPPKCSSSKAANVQRSPSLVEFYYSLTKCNREKGAVGGGNGCGPRPGKNAHCGIVGELENRSAHLLAIKSDVETKGDFIRFLIEKVQSSAYKDMEEAVAFVDWLDKELSTLADERAVLKHFNWPEKKADALREAAFAYRDLKKLETEIHSFEDDASVPCETALKKIANLLDKLERQIQRFTKLRDTAMLSYREWKIPTDWMLDSGVISKLKLASVKLAKVYMKRVKFESTQHSERESMQEPLLLQGVGFAYRVHQFAGGLDSETMSAFEEVRHGVHLHRAGSQELLPGVTLS